MFFDPMYLLFIAPGMILGFYAQWKVKSTFKKYANVMGHNSMTGAQIAQAILRTEGITGVGIEEVRGKLSDHYDPRAKMLRLSTDVYHGRNAAAAGVAAHEVGHAIQHAHAYRWLGMRSKLVPMVDISSKLGWIAIMGGLFLMSSAPVFGKWVFLLGFAMMGIMFLFQMVTLPVEFDASKRALAALKAGGLVSGSELAGSRKVLNAAALTYVAAAVQTFSTMLYFLLRSGLLGGRR